MDTLSTILLKKVGPDILITFANFFILFFLQKLFFLLIIWLSFKVFIKTSSMQKHCPLNNYNHETVYKIFFLTSFFPTRILRSRLYLHWNIHGV